jgi:hypothetical protein
METSKEKRAAVERVRKEFADSKDTRTGIGYVNALRLVSQVVFTRSSGFILELIQNAEDSGLKMPLQTGEVSIYLNKHRLKFVHNGEAFDETNLQAICNINSSKKPERGTLGYLGIGFKSVFKVTDCAEVYSNGFQFKFDRNHPEWAGHSGDTPWQVMPIWIENPTEAIEPDKTTFIIRFKDQEAADQVRESLKLLKAELYLFLKWITRIHIVDEISGDKTTLENAPKQGEIAVLKHGDKTYRFKFFRKEVAVPDSIKQDRLTLEYRANVKSREIAIAFAVADDGNLSPSSASAMYGGVYSFLPLAESKSGAKFPIQADFLVQPGRDAINYEAAWNKWLLDEVRQLCLVAIAEFQKNPVWKFQYLAAFEFTHSEELEAYKNLFGPKLIQPIEQFLANNPCVPTVDGNLARPPQVVCLTEEPNATTAIASMGLIKQEEVASVFGSGMELKLVHPSVVKLLPDKFRRVDRWSLFENEQFLNQKAASSDAPSWFRSLYLWLNKHPFWERIGRRTQIRRYDSVVILLAANQTLHESRKVWLLDLDSNDPFIEKLALEMQLQQNKPMLHPDILSGATDEKERESLRGFLMGYAGVQKLDTKTVCKEALLPKMVANPPQATPHPTADELITYTTYCQLHLGAEMPNAEILIVNKSGQIRPAREAFFPAEFRPALNWEANRQYVNGLDCFLSPKYLSGCTTDEQFRAWHNFFVRVGVKESPDNGVEEFAMNFAAEKLQLLFKNIEPVENRNFGYDMQAEDQASNKIYIEVKGLSSDNDVALTANEADAANIHRDRFYLCVVSGIPNLPMLRLVQNPASVGQWDKLTVRQADWQSGRVIS